MTAAADIVVKAADGTTNSTWNLITASGGDKTPALWRANAATGTLGQKPTFTISGRWNAAGDVRRIDFKGTFPSTYEDTSSSLTQVRSTMTMTASFAVPQNVADVDLAEFAAQMTNLIASSLGKASVNTGFAPV